MGSCDDTDGLYRSDDDTYAFGSADVPGPDSYGVAHACCYGSGWIHAPRLRRLRRGPSGHRDEPSCDRGGTFSS